VVGRPVADDEWSGVEWSGGDEERENRATGGGMPISDWNIANRLFG
jgi:hypothetical protein